MIYKSLKILLTSVLGLFLLVILEYARQGFLEDLSMQKINATEAISPVYMISYANGPEYFYRNQNAMTHYAINKNIDFFLNYKKNHIDKEFLDQNKQIFEEKTGGGMWLWKPYIIMQTLNKATEDSIIVYLDSAFKIKKPLAKFFKYLEYHDIVLTHDHARKNGSYIKGDSFALLDCLSEECRYAPHIMSGAIVIKNTEYARDFVKKWLDSMKDYKALSNKNFGIKDNYPEYQWHHFDQSILSLIYFKNQEKVKMIEFNELSEYFSLFHRKPSKSSPNKDYYTIYGIDPLINTNKYGKTLPSTSLLNLPPIVFFRKIIMDFMN